MTAYDGGLAQRRVVRVVHLLEEGQEGLDESVKELASKCGFIRSSAIISARLDSG